MCRWSATVCGRSGALHSPHWPRAAILDAPHAMCTHPAVNNGDLEQYHASTQLLVRRMHACSSVCTLIMAAKGFLHNTPRRPQPHHRVHWTTGANARPRMSDSPQGQSTQISRSRCTVGCMQQLHTGHRHPLTTSIAAADHTGSRHVQTRQPM